jgi:NAD(P)-dependent dehydrogenase (short-subunit alcohol dehydrogenase family)
MALPSRPRAVVTGGGSGLGRAICLELAKRGARVVVSDIDESTAHETIKLMRGGEGTFVRCDVSDPEQVEKLADESFRQLGGVDLLVNNAGVAVAGEIGVVPLADWQWVVGINMWGVIHGCHFFIPRMRKAKGGHVLNVASAAGLLCGPKMGPYNVTKAAVVGLSETLRADLAADNIGVSVLCPTFFQTNIAKNSRGSEEMRPLVEELLRAGKLSAEDVARMTLEAVDGNRLYVTPHTDGLWLWRMKRAVPERFYDWMPKLTSWRLKQVMKKARPA